MIELKKCPFCGWDASITAIKDMGVCVSCTNPKCGCRTKYKVDNLGLLGSWPEETAIEEVVNRWNKRIEESENDEQATNTTNG